MAKLKITGMVNISNIYGTIECPACKRSYNVQMKNPNFSHNCRCDGATMYFHIAQMGNKLIVSCSVSYAFLEKVPLRITNLRIERPED